MRNMSFMLTTQQMKDGIKDVTRRLGWGFLKPGNVVMAVEKCQGLKRGEKVKKLYPIEIVSVRSEPLNQISSDDIVREGFPDMRRYEFVSMFMASHKGCTYNTVITRIEFRRIK